MGERNIVKTSPRNHPPDQFRENKWKFLLKECLGKYIHLKKRVRILERRMAEFQAEFNSPSIKSPLGNVMPSGSGQSVGAASLTLKIADIMERIERERGRQIDAMKEIMDILDWLPADSMEREILEYRYIDGMRWEDIYTEVHLTRSPCFVCYNRGLDQLLQHKAVCALLDRYSARMATGTE